MLPRYLKELNKLNIFGILVGRDIRSIFKFNLASLFPYKNWSKHEVCVPVLGLSSFQIVAEALSTYLILKVWISPNFIWFVDSVQISQFVGRVEKHSIAVESTSLINKVKKNQSIKLSK
jgi:hypothetical protein